MKTPRWLASSAEPLQWNLVLGMALCGAAGAAVAAVLLPSGMLLAAVVGLILGLVVASAPVIMALRLLLVNGALLVVVAAVAQVSRESAVLAGVGMAMVAFVGGIWTGLPVVGAVMGTLPVVVYLLIGAKGAEIAPDASSMQAGLAAACGALGAAAVAVVLSMPDPRKADRGAAAAMWQSDLPVEKRQSLALVLALNSASRKLRSLATLGTLTDICRRRWIRDSPEAADAAGLAAAERNSAALAAAILQRRSTQAGAVSIEQPDPPSAAPSDADHKARQCMFAAQSRAAEVLDESHVTPPHVRPLLALSGQLLARLLRPDARSFRFAVQRSLALGVGMWAVVHFSPSENAFWIVLTISTVLLPDSPTTLVRAAQRSVGTIVGVLLALPVAALLPEALLTPVAVVGLLVGLAYMNRNYSVFAALVGSAIVLLLGAPDDQFLAYAAMRGIDVVVGGAIALAVATIVLPVRPDPQKRLRSATAAFRSAIAALERYEKGSTSSTRSFYRAQADAIAARTGLAGDLSAVASDPAMQKRADELQTLADELYVLAAVVVGLPQASMSDTPLLSATADLDRRFRALEAG